MFKLPDHYRKAIRMQLLHAKSGIGSGQSSNEVYYRLYDRLDAISDVALYDMTITVNHHRVLRILRYRALETALT